LGEALDAMGQHQSGAAPQVHQQSTTAECGSLYDDR
jgi:hypothetical protein